MGIHRNVIHPGFGNFSLLGTVLVDAEVSEYSHPIVYNPCLECNAVRRCLSDGATGPASSISLPCYAHNHREFMGGFSDWVEQIADSGSAHEYREKVSPSEMVSMWQGLSFCRQLQGGVLHGGLP
jgi:hypothetical protein